MQMIGHSLYNPEAYPDWFTILKAIDAESPIIVIFFGTIGIVWWPEITSLFSHFV